MDESVYPERIWKRVFREKMWMVEDCNPNQGGYPADLLFTRLPKFTKYGYIWLLSGLAVVGIVISFFLYTGSHPVSRVNEWIANLLLNVAMGVVASILISWHATNRDRIVAGYGAVVKLLKERLSLFEQIDHDDFGDPLFSFQNKNDSDEGLGWLYVRHNFCCTITEFFRYLTNKLSTQLPSYDFKRVVKELDCRNGHACEMIRELDKKIRGGSRDPEYERECASTMWRDTRVVFATLQNLITRLESDVYGVQYGKAAKDEIRDCQDSRKIGYVEVQKRSMS